MEVIQHVRVRHMSQIHVIQPWDLYRAPTSLERRANFHPAEDYLDSWGTINAIKPSKRNPRAATKPKWT
ncbi:hypothetical protein KY290_012735 [Solanum tuberosum]|uniref:Uncharacterized protein n=1 Tax=Solanum tuberosum TaxID=4113 RepID=A0ABQ7VJT4_SOLTU|nr:hypothetical protein KY285_012610 [Solanum tuberosum]KAH0768754.1 hypothetical protein KY290_012735 [Solanum tuberosum]